MMAFAEEKRNVPLVSVVMAAYNAEKYIEKAIRSVTCQTISDWELIIVDDCSQDRTCSIVEKLSAEDRRIRLLRNETNLGVARTRNRAMDVCKGWYTAFLDSDDTWHAEKLAKQIARMEETGAEISYCSYALIDASGGAVRSDYLVPERVTYETLLVENVMGCSTVMLHHDVARTYRFQADLYHEDYALWLQILKDGHGAAGCTEVLADWRYIRGSRSFNKWKSARNRWRIYRKYLRLSPARSAYLLGCYMLAGIKKYRRKA